MGRLTLILNLLLHWHVVIINRISANAKSSLALVTILSSFSACHMTCANF